MANWYGASRSNYVRISDIEGLKASLSRTDIQIHQSTNNPGFYCLLYGDNSNGDWPSFIYDEAFDEIEFDFETFVMPFVKEGECLVIMTSGAEKLRYITGHASAYVRHSGEVISTHLSLNDIYRQAQEELGCEDITEACY